MYVVIVEELICSVGVKRYCGDASARHCAGSGEECFGDSGEKVCDNE